MHTYSLSKVQLGKARSGRYPEVLLAILMICMVVYMWFCSVLVDRSIYIYRSTIVGTVLTDLGALWFNLVESVLFFLIFPGMIDCDRSVSNLCRSNF